jgi:TetR/AcrR family transcriptional regulator
MGISERKQREKEARQKAIIDAAEAVIFSKGYDQATMDEIAAQAELSKGTLYLYFKSKEQLYMSIVQRGFELQQRLFREALNSGRNGLEKVRAIGEAWLRFYRDYPNYFNATMYYESLQLDTESVDEITALCMVEGHSTHQMLIGAIDEGKADGSIRNRHDSVKIAMVLWATATGLLQLNHYKGKVMQEALNVHPREVTPVFFAMMERALTEE